MRSAPMCQDILDRFGGDLAIAAGVRDGAVRQADAEYTRRVAWLTRRRDTAQQDLDRMDAKTAAAQPDGPYVVERRGEYRLKTGHLSRTADSETVARYAYRRTAERLASEVGATVQTWAAFEQAQYAARQTAPATQPAWYAEEARLLDES